MNQELSPNPAGESAAPSNKMIENLRALIAKNTRRWKMLIVLEALALIIAVPLAFLWIAFATDNYFHLPMWGRILVLLAFVGVSGYLIWSLIKRWKQLNFTEDQVALAMEKRSGGLENRLINSIQLAREGARAAGFSQTVVEENFNRLQKIEVQQAAQMKPAVIRVAVAGGIVLVGVGFYLAQPQYFSNAFQRIMMPLKNVDPIYRTIVMVEPGNITTRIGTDVPIKMSFKGKTPDEVRIVQIRKSGRVTETVKVDPTKDTAFYTFKNVDQKIGYIIIGGDYTTERYDISVPTPAQINAMVVEYDYPAYSKLPKANINTGVGDLEALIGTQAKVTFTLDQPAESAYILLQTAGLSSANTASKAASAASGNDAPAEAAKPAVASDGIKRLQLKKISPTQYQGTFEFRDILAYQIETVNPGSDPFRSSRYGIKIKPDDFPLVDLTGIPKTLDILPDTVLNTKITATDDLGLARVGVFYRKVNQAKLDTAPAPDASGNDASASRDEGWLPIQTWETPDGRKKYEADYKLSIQSLGLTEGERIEVVVRAQDGDPAKTGSWAAGDTFALMVGGDGASYQLVYEQILRSEAQIKELIDNERKAMQATSTWIQKVDTETSIRWDDEKVRADLSTSTRAMAKKQDEVRTQAGQVARSIIDQAQGPKMSVAIIADTEMVATIRVLEAVAQRDHGQAIRAALADARNVQERTLKGLDGVLTDYVKFRQDWEKNNMTAFVKMIGEREMLLKEESLVNKTPDASKSLDLVQKSARTRQLKVLELSGLAQTAFADLAIRMAPVEGDPEAEILKMLAGSFTVAAKDLADPALKTAMQQAADLAGSGKFADAAPKQEEAALKLLKVYTDLKAVQDAVALKRTEIAKKEESNAKEQEKIKELQSGNTEDLLNGGKDLKIDDSVTMGDAGAQGDKGKGKLGESVLYDFDKAATDGILNPGKQDKRQELDMLSLSDKPGGDMSFPNSSDKKANAVTPQIQEKFDDLMGPLIDAADLVREDFESYRTQYGGVNAEAGDVGMQGGDLSSTSATAATGNQKQPPNNFGGASRSGRTGARAFGQNVDDVTKNEKGRDKAQDGDENSPRTAGSMKEGPGEPDSDVSAAYGGKHIDSKDTVFSQRDSAKFKKEAIDTMGDPQEKRKIVERMDPNAQKFTKDMLDKMYDANGKTEQIIERVKTIKKELNNLYLPTEELDKLAKELEINLDRMKENPDPELFRMQADALSRLVSLARVLDQAQSSFQPSIPRAQKVRGRVLDEPAWQVIPGYEDAVKKYYESLSEAR
jgi:HPt (histidine-containing phosphotransfer) domain-containing protein